MSIPDWPSGLPQAPLRSGYGEEPERNVAEYKPDVGAPLGRARSLVESDLVEASFLLAGAELDLFWNFYEGTLQSGVLQFRLRDPRLGEVRVFTFAAPPRARARSGLHDRYELSASLRRMP